MNTSKIEISLTPPAPHFDDDATIATARQVVPLNGQKTVRRGRVLAILPLLVGSMMCGALGALAVIYLERGRDHSAAATQQPAAINVSTESRAEPSPVNTEPQLPAGTLSQTPVQAAASQAISAEAPAPKQPKIETRDELEPKTPPAIVKNEPAPDPTKLTRKRRVQPKADASPRRNRRNDASHIEDIFTGPNP